MTPQEERSLKTLHDSIAYAGFGDRYHAEVERAFKAGEPQAQLEPSYKDYGNGTYMVWEPKVEEPKNATNYGLYFNGFRATLFQEDKEPVSHFFAHFKVAGPTTEQAYMLLSGATVLHEEWDKRKDQRKEVFTRLDLKTLVADGAQRPIIRINADQVNLGKLYSMEDIQGSQKTKEKNLELLQAGYMVQATSRVRVNGVPTQRQVTLALVLPSDKEMQMAVMNEERKLIDLHRVPVVENALARTVGMQTGIGEKTQLPENVLKMLNKKDELPKMGGHSVNRA